MDNKPAIRQFLGRFFRTELRDQDDFFSAGFVNSLFIIQLVLFIERDFGVAIEDRDLELSNFNSIENIDAFIERATNRASHTGQQIGSEP
jgi:acyl carrier protein